MSIGDFLSRIGGNFRDNVSAAPPEAWYSLAQALQGGHNLAQGLGQGMVGFGSELQAAKKKKGLAAAFQNMEATIPESQRPAFQALIENNPEAVLKAYAGNLFSQPKEQTSDIQNYEYARGQGFKGSYFDFKNQLALSGAGVSPVPIPGVGNVNPKTGQVMTGGEPPAPQPQPTTPPQGIKPDRPGVYFDPAMHPELGDGMLPPEAKPIMGPQQQALGLSTAPQGQQWVFGPENKPSLQPVPGYKPQSSQIPAELNAKLGLANGFLKRYPQINKDLEILDSPIGRIAGAANEYRAGEIKRQIKSGSEALVRLLTGAGKSQQEATDQVSQYLPGAFDTAFTMRSKLHGLRFDIENVIKQTMEPYGGWTSPIPADVEPAPLPSSPIELKKGTVYKTQNGNGRYIGNGKFEAVQ